LSSRVVVALILGLLVGAWVHAQNNPTLSEAATLVKALGGLWLNALQMTVVPLVFSLVVVGIASVADAVSTGKLAGRAVMLFTFLIICASIYGIAATNGALALWPINGGDTTGLLGRIPQGAPAAATAPDFAAWIQSLAPSNVIAAAAKPDMLQLVTFAVFFG